MGGKLREGTTAPKRRKQITDWELWKVSAGTFLCEIPPEDFNQWENAIQYDWLQDNAWEPLEFYSGDQIWDFIDDHAMALKGFLNSKNIEVKETIHV